MASPLFVIEWGWFFFIAQPLFIALQWTANTVTHNYGWAIILLTIVINTVLFPLRLSSMKSSKKMQAIHLDGAFLTTRAALRHMKASGQGGTVLYMGSVHSKLASTDKGPYTAAKHALLGLARGRGQVVAAGGAADDPDALALVGPQDDLERGVLQDGVVDVVQPALGQVRHEVDPGLLEPLDDGLGHGPSHARLR